jgi:predicted DCC family thiol-disulfide oxidoreductase YuxK
MSHLVFYDGECGFCDQVVQLLLKADKRKKFLFAPLQGKTAARLLKELPEGMKGIDTLVLVENYQQPSQRFLILGKAAFRIMWLLGGFWSLIGWISFLPGWLYNWGYRLVARNRKRLFPVICCVIPDPNQKDRFLD